MKEVIDIVKKLILVILVTLSYFMLGISMAFL